jgi:type II secretory pathway component PulM
VVVLWGAARQTLPEGAHKEGIDFVPGRQLVHWLKSLETDLVTKVAAADLIKRLEGFRAEAWDNSTR